MDGIHRSYLLLSSILDASGAFAGNEVLACAFQTHVSGIGTALWIPDGRARFRASVFVRETLHAQSGRRRDKKQNCDEA